jgi:hypothetical protein
MSAVIMRSLVNYGVKSFDARCKFLLIAAMCAVDHQKFDLFRNQAGLFTVTRSALLKDTP